MMDGPAWQLASICTRIAATVRSVNLRATVESTFADAANLVTADGRRLALVSDRAGDGPLNALVTQAQALATLRPGDVIAGDGRRLYIGRGRQIGVELATLWDPYPDYAQLATQPALVRINVSWLAQLLPAEAPAESLAAAIKPPSATSAGRPAGSQLQARGLALTGELRRAHAHRDQVALREIAGRLAGLGPGLTPAGDDWMAGWLIGLRARQVLEGPANPSAEEVGAIITQAAAGRTSALSLAYLHAAVDGAAPQAWHDLIRSLRLAAREPLHTAIRAIISHGATSGADMLAGFAAAMEPLC